MYKINPLQEGDSDKLNQLIVDYNLSHVPYPQNPPWETLGYTIKDDKGEIIGGIFGSLIMNNVLSIHVLYIDSKLRHQGYGSKLITQLENKARNHGAYMSNVNTFDFQALDFYLKHGYKVFGVLEDHPAPKHKGYYLSKRLDTI